MQDRYKDPTYMRSLEILGESVKPEVNLLDCQCKVCTESKDYNLYMHCVFCLSHCEQSKQPQTYDRPVLPS